MTVDQMHPEDIKAAIRKQFGSVGQFVEERGLPKTGVSDLFRGRTSKRVRDAVEEVVRAQIESIELDNSSPAARPHRKSAGAK